MAMQDDENQTDHRSDQLGLENRKIAKLHYENLQQISSNLQLHLSMLLLMKSTLFCKKGDNYLMKIL